mgnify:CR=1 FL=1
MQRPSFINPRRCRRNFNVYTLNDNLVDITDAIFHKMFLGNKSDSIVSFTDVVQLMGGGTPKTDNDSYWNGAIPFFTPKDTPESPFCISTEKTFNFRWLEELFQSLVSTVHNFCYLPWNCWQFDNGRSSYGNESILLCIAR